MCYDGYMEARCKNCQNIVIAKKFWNVLCLECRKKRDALWMIKYRKQKPELFKKIAEKYYEKNKDKVLFQNKSYYIKNRDLKVEYARNRRKEHKEHILNLSKLRYNIKREHILKQAKESYQRRKDKIGKYGKKYRSENKEDIRLRNKNRIHKLRTLEQSSDITHKWLKDLFIKSKNCVLCNYVFNGIDRDKHLDHIMPVGIGGKHNKDNVRFLCKNCNLSRPKDGRDLTKTLNLMENQ